MSRLLRFVAVLLAGSWLALALVPADAAQTMRERTYKRLTKIHEQMGEGQYVRALRGLDALMPSVRKIPYELAVVEQTYGYVYAAQEKYPQAIEHFERALDTDALPEEATKSMLYNLAQLYMAVERWDDAVRTFERWLRLEPEPSPDAHAMVGTAYAQLKRYDPAIDHLRRAIAAADKPQETWYQILLAIYYERKQYPEAAATLEDMIRLFPRQKDYWVQLSGVYFQMKKDQRSLAVLELARKWGVLTKESERVNLASLYLLMDIPYKAAKILAAAMDEGIVRPNLKHWQLLSDAWLRARELDRALVALRRAAALADSGELYLRCAQISAEREDWEEVRKDLDRALEKGGMKHPGNAWLLLANAYYELDRFDDAMQALKRAERFDDTAKQARQWMNFIESERALRS